MHIFSRTCSAVVHPDSSELFTSGGVSRRDVCLLSNIMELDGTSLAALKIAKKYILNTRQQ